MNKSLFSRSQAKFLAVLAIGLAAGWAVSASAEIPTNQVNMIPAGLVNYQGTLLTPTNSPYANGIYDIDFRIYPESSGGPDKALWGAGYKVFVNNGVFGVMLGKSGGTALNDNPTEFQPDELWKALWFDEGSPENLDLFLGITVKNDQNGNPIATPAEAMPRQQFLTTPYAARAQQAMYARRASGDFDVGGNLTAPNIITDDIHAVGDLTASNVTVSGVTASSLTVGSVAASSLSASSLSANSISVLNLTASGTISGFGTIPVGGIIIWRGATNEIPVGWALCNGQTKNGQTTPDLRGRFVLGLSSGRSIGDKAGEETHTLTIDEMPMHTHDYGDWRETDKGVSYDESGGGGDGTERIDTNRTTQVTGGSLPHNNMPPYYVLAYIMRVQ